MPPAEARAACAKALALWPGIAEAHSVLALHAASFEEALALFERASAAGADGLDVNELLAHGETWGNVAARSWMRGIFGTGNTLRKLKRYEQALEQYEVRTNHSTNRPTNQPTDQPTDHSPLATICRCSRACSATFRRTPPPS